MKLRLKEEPKEWLKFTAALAVVAGAIVAMSRYRGWIPGPVAAALLGALAVLLACGLARPRLVRPLYRAGMTVSFCVGQVVGRILLALIFISVLTPMGLALRLFGKDLLRLRRRPGSASYWRAARPGGPLDRQF